MLILNRLRFQRTLGLQGLCIGGDLLLQSVESLLPVWYLVGTSRSVLVSGHDVDQTFETVA